MLLLIVLASYLTYTRGFYLPGVAPVSFCEDGSGQENCQTFARVFVNRLNSRQTVMPYEYEKFDFCTSDSQSPVENLGQILMGDRIRPSPYELQYRKATQCNEVCVKNYTAGDQEDAKKLGFLKDAIRLNYLHHWIVDNMPVAWCYQVEGMKKPLCTRSFPIGCYVTKTGVRKGTCSWIPAMVKNDTYYLNNHVHFTVKYHRDEANPSFGRIVFVSVTPQSVQYRERCRSTYGHVAIPGGELKENLTVRYTYSLVWAEDKVTSWASRWDSLLEPAVDINISWFSIVNSTICILFLTGTVVACMIRALKGNKDQTKDVKDSPAIIILFLTGTVVACMIRALKGNKDQKRDVKDSGTVVACMIRALKGNKDQTRDVKDSDDGLGKYEKWKLLHGDVFRPPRYGMLLAALNGSGIQILFTATITLQFACFGFLSPANRGALLQCALVLFVMSAFPAGVASSRVYRRVPGGKWKTNAALTALLCPGVVFALFLIFNTVLWINGSSGAVPFTTLLLLLGLWLGVSLPLTFFGACLGFKKGKLIFPEKINEVPREVPKRSIIFKTLPGMLMGGILPFGCLFIQLFLIFNSIWFQHVYYQFGLLLFVYLLFIIICIEVTIILCYFHLIAQDYHWWWRSFLSGGFTSVYVFAYSINYYLQKLDLIGGTSAFLFFGYTFMMCFMLFLLTGCVGFFACFFFIKKIYQSINKER